jgi:hypothetical protein
MDRCARPMEPREMRGEPYEPEPVCGRPAGHRGQCLSAAAWRHEIERAREQRFRKRSSAR